MLRTALTLALPLALLAGCATAPANSGAAVPLGNYHWQLASATTAAGQPIASLQANAGPAPVELSFGETFSAYAGCNRMVGSYQLTGDTLRVGSLMSTMIGCPPALDQRDRTLGAALEKPLTIRTRTAQQLVLVTAQGDVLDFTGTPTAETRFGGPGERVFLEVAAHTASCTPGAGAPTQCLQVRELHYDDQGLKVGTPGEFSHFYANIEGYEHQDGVRNVLRVKRFRIANPPADASALAYVLDMTVETELVDR